MCNCKTCNQKMYDMQVEIFRLSGLVNSLQPGTKEDWEYSEPLGVGGAAGTFTLRAPFVGDCEYSVQQVSGGNATMQIMLSSHPIPMTVDYSSAAQGTAENSGLNGITSIIPANSTIPSVMVFVPLRNSENILYGRVSGTAAAYATVIFRQKR